MTPSISGSIVSPGAMLGTSITFLIACMVVSCLRFWVRVLQKSRFRADDWLVIPAFAAYLAICIVVFVGVHQKLIGYTSRPYVNEISNGPMREVLNGTLLSVFAALSLGFSKLSILYFYKRVLCSAHHTTPFEIVVNVFIALVALWTLAFTIMPALVCGSHYQAQWSSQRSKYCWAEIPSLEAFAYTDLILETFIVLLPVPKIWSLKISIRRRLGIVFVFLTAFISLAAATTRVVIFTWLDGNYSPRIAGKPTDGGLASTAEDWVYVLETGSALLAVNLPSLYYLRNKIAPEKVLASVRSVFSLQSLSSKGSRQNMSGTAGESKPDQTVKLGRAQQTITTTTSSHSEGTEYDHAHEDVRDKHGIQVTSHISHQYDQV